MHMALSCTVIHVPSHGPHSVRLHQPGPGAFGDAPARQDGGGGGGDVPYKRWIQETAVEASSHVSGLMGLHRERGRPKRDDRARLRMGKQHVLLAGSGRRRGVSGEHRGGMGHPGQWHVLLYSFSDPSWPPVTVANLPTYAVNSSFTRPSLEVTVVNTRQGYNNGCRSIAVLSGRVPRFKPRRRPPSSTPTRARVDPSSPFLSFSLNCVLLKARGYGSQTMQSTVL